jgi:hypothetical protein
MPERTLHPEFRDQNEFSRYPFADSATLQSSHALVFENSTFLDAAIYPVGIGDVAFLSSIDVGATDATIYIGDEHTLKVASGEFNLFNPTSTIRLKDTYGRPAGMLLSDETRLAIFQSWPKGEHVFRKDATAFLASVVVPTPAIGLRGLLTAKDELLTGDIWIVGDDGIVVRDDDGDIRVDIVGDPLFARRLCGPDGTFVQPTFLQTINGIKPDVNGDFKITVCDVLVEDTILRIFSDDGAIKIEAVGQTIEK